MSSLPMEPGISEPLRLRPPRHRVSPRAIAWWTTQATLEVAVVLIPLGIAVSVWADARAWLVPTTVAAVAIGLAYLLVMPRWRFRVHRWETTEDAVYTSQGWINQEWRVAPMSRIQTVDTERGPLQQMFGLATVTVTTASAAGALRLTGLDRAVADELVAQLTATTQATPGDAT
ncbi:MAG TPA: PH domain-containing protein [Pseudonocardiaceae bacterium]|jgi:membrane protein YdbS with pleckstrin-like domain|nr:PH domain-containing protein [Pseudonocardiaceae bacterium]